MSVPKVFYGTFRIPVLFRLFRRTKSFRSNLHWIHECFGKDMPSAVPLLANKHAGFSREGRR